MYGLKSTGSCEPWPPPQWQLQRPPPVSAHASPPPPQPLPDHTMGGGGVGNARRLTIYIYIWCVYIYRCIYIYIDVYKSMRVCPCVSMYRTKMRRNTRQKESWRACAHSPVKEVRADYIDTRQTPKVPHFLWPRCQSQLEPHRTCRRMGRPSAAASRSLQKPLETFRDCALLQVLLLDSPSTTCQLFASPTTSGNFRCLVAVESQKTCACYVPRLFSTPQASVDALR